MKSILRIVFAISCVIFSLSVEARDCGSCHGKGWKRVFVGVSNYGVGGGRTRQCQYCGKHVSSSDNHYCICTTCGGTGQAGGSRGGTSMLHPDEAKNVQLILELLNYGEPYYPDCNICKGSGNCPHCHGASRNSYYDWETGLTYGACVACGSSGICPTCRGGRKGAKQYKPISNQRREQCLDMLRTIMLNASKRTQR
ncbi:MAG: hypothetical protein K2K75_00595 [Muribaculaceae bacterium]|nr:hypothetical protein [Muribaculaceae bacterium]